MKKLIVVSLVFMMLFAFVACSGEPGGTSGGGGGGNGNGSELTPAEQAIKSKYGDDVFYFAEMADMAASYVDMVTEICGAADAASRTAAVNMYNQYSQNFTVSNASATGLTVEGSDGGDHIKVVITNVAFSNPKGQWVSFDADITVSGSFNATAKVSLEIYLSNGSLTITDGRYNSVNFGQGTPNNQKAQQCLQEIQALDENGNNQGQGGQGGQGQGQEPGQGTTWTDGTDSLTKTASQILTTLEGMNFEVTIRKAMGMEGVNYWFVYGRIDDNLVWAKRYDEYPEMFQTEPQYDMVAMDGIEGHQFQGPYDDEVSDYLLYEDNGYSDAWDTADTFIYHDEDGSRNWHESMVYWIYGGEDIFDPDYATDYPGADYLGEDYEHYALMLKPYTPYNLSLANGKYKIQAGKKTVAGQTCTVYQYQQYYYYISDLYGICMKETYIDANKGEVATWEVTKFTLSPTWPVN